MAEASKTGAELFNALSFHLLTYLEQRPGVTELAFEHRDGCSADELNAWDRHHSLTPLPPDFAAFLRSFNGLRFSWRVDIARRGSSTVGALRLHKLAELQEVNLHLDADDDPFGLHPGEAPPLALSIEKSERVGNVALVYRRAPGDPGDDSAPRARPPSVWFQDLACCWHYVAPDFASYFRLMVVHLGILGWQYAYTDVGLDPAAKQWMLLYCPERLAADETMRDQEMEAGIQARPDSPAKPAARKLEASPSKHAASPTTGRSPKATSKRSL
ncbi:hypothetical protein M885DRAFT_619073 [Pelagophyceae sp. CCMP2097]|nr:hypothetical protein M885DRAFT_619073 [Pelagophyceae sp. CCMP2097]|mmetsp:Transcript_10923/g.38532  ORF Transcript_10923/g.38532 Transcript_10923/m.38532 type:complete len:272 (+) Transcript_10923:85-900(+)